MELVDRSSLAKLDWKASKKCNGGACVEVAHDDATIFLGDAKNPSGPVLACTRPQWQEFIDLIKRGDLDSI